CKVLIEIFPNNITLYRINSLILPATASAPKEIIPPQNVLLGMSLDALIYLLDRHPDNEIITMAVMLKSNMDDGLSNTTVFECEFQEYKFQEQKREQEQLTLGNVALVQNVLKDHYYESAEG